VKIELGDTVTLKDNEEFRGVIIAITGWGDVHLEVLDWAGETGGYRGRDGVLSKTRYPQSRLEKVEVKNTRKGQEFPS